MIFRALRFILPLFSLSAQATPWDKFPVPRPKTVREFGFTYEQPMRRIPGTKVAYFDAIGIREAAEIPVSITDPQLQDLVLRNFGGLTFVQIQLMRELFGISFPNEVFPGDARMLYHCRGEGRAGNGHLLLDSGESAGLFSLKGNGLSLEGQERIHVVLLALNWLKGVEKPETKDLTYLGSELKRIGAEILENDHLRQTVSDEADQVLYKHLMEDGLKNRTLYEQVYEIGVDILKGRAPRHTLEDIRASFVAQDYRNGVLYLPQALAEAEESIRSITRLKKVGAPSTSVKIFFILVLPVGFNGTIAVIGRTPVHRQNHSYLVKLPKSWRITSRMRRHLETDQFGTLVDLENVHTAPLDGTDDYAARVEKRGKVAQGYESGDDTSISKYLASVTAEADAEKASDTITPFRGDYAEALSNRVQFAEGLGGDWRSRLTKVSETGWRVPAIWLIDRASTSPKEVAEVLKLHAAGIGFGQDGFFSEIFFALLRVRPDLAQEVVHSLRASITDEKMRFEFLLDVSQAYGEFASRLASRSPLSQEFLLTRISLADSDGQILFQMFEWIGKILRDKSKTSRESQLKDMRTSLNSVMGARWTGIRENAVSIALASAKAPYVLERALYPGEDPEPMRYASPQVADESKSVWKCLLRLLIHALQAR